jgi:uncharacterized protein (DUF927 family)
VSERALRSAEQVLGRWLPDGKREGQEWVALNPTRADATRHSFSINIASGKWSDFATDDKGGDLVSLVAYLERCGQFDAAMMLARALGISVDHFAQRAGSPPPASREGGEASPGYRPVMPIPPHALPYQPKQHPKLGAPAHTWCYRDAAGDLLMLVCRFEIESEQGRAKEYRPLSFGAHGAAPAKWAWKMPESGRPLYGLDRLAAKRGAPVVLVEGEKAADAAAVLFPAQPCLTWPSGSKAIHKADWQPLAGREVIYWHDNDSAGVASIPGLERALQSVGARWLGVVCVDTFARYRPGVDAQGCVTLEPGEGWPDKADAADAVRDGWTAEHVELLQARGLLLAQPQDAPSAPDDGSDRPVMPASEGEATGGPEPFRVAPNGLFFWSHKQERYLRAGDYLEIIGVSRSREGTNYGVLVRFSDVDQVTKEWNIPTRLFAPHSGGEVLAELLDRGYKIETARDARNHLFEYLQSYRDQQRILLTERMGWYDGAFLLPGHVIGNPLEPLRYYSDDPSPCKIATAGTVAEWQEHVARYCVGNVLPLFAVSAAFAAPLLELVGEPSSGFHFHGDSSLGKSMLLRLACSVYGRPDQYMQSWKATDNALEGTASAFNGCLLVLDEIGQADSRIVGDTCYMLGNEIGKARATDRGALRTQRHRWRLLFLSSGERTLQAHMADGGRSPLAGQEMRLLSLHASPHEDTASRRKFGCFSTLHGAQHGAELSEQITRGAGQYHGAAFIAFIERLVGAASEPKLLQWVEGIVSRFKAHHLSEKASGQVQRAARKFALVAAAGELATRWQVTGWPEGEALRAVEACFASWKAAYGGEGSAEDRELLAHLRLTFQKRGESNFTRWDHEEARIDNHQPRTMEAWGFVKVESIPDSVDGESTERIFYVYPDAWRREICKGYDADRGARLLSELGALECQGSERRLQKRVRLPGGGRSAKWVYVIRSEALYGDDAAGESIA